MSADDIIRRLTQPSTAERPPGAMSGEEAYMALARLFAGEPTKVPGAIVAPETASQMIH